MQLQKWKVCRTGERCGSGRSGSGGDVGSTPAPMRADQFIALSPLRPCISGCSASRQSLQRAASTPATRACRLGRRLEQRPPVGLERVPP